MKTEVRQVFESEILPTLNPTDKVAIRCAWNDYVDALQKDGQITERQAMTWTNPYAKERKHGNRR